MFPFAGAVDEEYAARTWQTLHDAIREIHRQNASGLSFEELYRNAYNMVLHKFGDKLYQGLVDTITSHLQVCYSIMWQCKCTAVRRRSTSHHWAQEVANGIQNVNDEQFLLQLKDKWEKHKLSSIMIRDILMYMDRTYVAAQKKVPVYERGRALLASTRARGQRQCSDPAASVPAHYLAYPQVTAVSNGRSSYFSRRGDSQRAHQGPAASHGAGLGAA